MAKLVDLTAKPYHLNEDQIKWVNETIGTMTEEEKVGQLFTNLFFFGEDKFSGNALTNKEILDKFHIGGARYQGGSAKKVQDLINSLSSSELVNAAPPSPYPPKGFVG